MMMKVYILVIVLSMALLSSASLAADLMLETVPPELRAAYEGQKQDIEILINRIKDSSVQGSERTAVLNKLRQRFPYLVLPVASSLVLDTDPDVQVAATQIVADSVIMMNHPMPSESEMHAQFMKSMQALISVLKEGVPEARKISATTGATLGDQEILKEISVLNQAGDLQDDEAIGYYTLAEPDLGAPYINKYLSSKSQVAQQQAIAYLGSLPEYQGNIRQAYLLDSSKAVPLRAAAARVLARTDATFDTYSSKVVSQPGTPIQVLDAIIRGSVENSANPVNAKQLNKYDEYIDTFGKANPTADLRALDVLRTQLDTLE